MVAGAASTLNTMAHTHTVPQTYLVAGEAFGFVWLGRAWFGLVEISGPLGRGVVGGSD